MGQDGLSSAEASRRLAAEGFNELAPPQRRKRLALALHLAREPMFLLLLAASAVYLLLGDPAEAAMLLGFVLVIMGLTLYQELRTSRVLDALRELSSPRATVIRDGLPVRIAGREVVRGDLMILAEGERVAADGRLLEGHDLVIDESLLTGESVPVKKAVRDGDIAPVAGGDDQPWVFGGTLVAQGGGHILVTATGRASALGRIGEALGRQPETPSPLQRQFRRLVARLALVAICASLLLAALLVWRGAGMLHALLAAITLAMSALPEELPVVVAVFLALGAWRISHHRVLTRRADAIETLGATTVLCVDKTGTLTQNRMRIARLWADGETHQVAGDTLPECFHRLLEFGILASEVAPFDPMEQAFHALGQALLGGSPHLHADWRIVHEYSLSPELPAMTHVWHGAGEAQLVVATKGAPEAVADLCHADEMRRRAILDAASRFADAGLRVLGVAAARLRPGGAWPDGQHDIDFEFLGLIALEDPLRAEVPAAIAEARGAGCRVVIITGDYPRTALAVARAIGLDAGTVVAGAELERMDDAELRRCVAQTNVFARVQPVHKLRLVQAFKANGEIVAMTGDGVNDAPALKAADIGVAMGRRGTDVAREAAHLVLLDDDFGALVATLRLGRRIFDNLRKALAYTVAVHVPIVGMSLLPALLGEPLVLLPALVVFYELVIGPSSSLVFESEPEDPALMRRPPRNPAEPIFGSRRLTKALLQGAVAFVIAMLAYLIALGHGWPEDRCRTLVFVVMVLGNLALLATNRAPHQPLWQAFGRTNPMRPRVLLGAAGGVMLVTQLAWLERLFRFAPLHMQGWLAVALAASLTVLALEGLRRLRADAS